jgi:hypothetical protein
LLHRQQIAPPEGDPFCAKHRAWWEALQVSLTERLHVRHDLATLDQVVGRLGEIDAELRRLSCAEPWSDVTPYLLHLPGVGLIVAMTVLVGHPDLRRTLHLTIHETFNQRLTVRYHLGPLDLQETIGYVKHQAQVAGHKTGTLFTDDALQRVFEYTKGIPRRINQVCTTALMAGLIDQKSVLDESTIRKAIADIDHD